MLPYLMGSEEPLEPDYLPGSHQAKVDDTAIYEALKDAFGNMAAAARSLGVSRRYFVGRVSRNPVLVAATQDYREEIIDQAETNVFEDVKKNDPTANRFVLSTLGGDRGWRQSVSGTGKNGEIVVQINRLSPENPDGT